MAKGNQGNSQASNTGQEQAEASRTVDMEITETQTDTSSYLSNYISQGLASRQDHIFSEIALDALDSEGLFKSQLDLDASTAVESAAQYIQDGDLGLWWTNSDPGDSENVFIYLTVGDPQLSIQDISNSSYESVNITYAANEKRKLDDRFGSSGTSIYETIVNEVAALSSQLSAPSAAGRDINAQVVFGNFQRSDISIFGITSVTSEKLLEVETRLDEQGNVISSTMTTGEGSY
jgi:hypothetical protein